ncbi:hypothetical protein K491DRAFT_241252 [Lophiostoma macrostomum CBS 122681]|uniref:Uncharacterized protein n=1 Tax=Lophiostoma macrostomum CBS 122681 TaxID=1314788 RepID=A0A6A6SL45_9PLEO|nr:hypothetical protein K491DRAFT_241252 [Lophiostoma macrostomum CBS 122681]
MPPRRSLFEMVFGVEQPPASPRKRKKTEVGALLSDQGFSETAINKHLEAEKVMDPMPKKRRKTEVEMLLRGQSLSEHAIGEYMRQARVPVASTSRSNGKNASGARKKKKKKKKKRMLVDKEPFPFLSLPAELRNKIYKLVIGGHVIRSQLGLSSNDPRNKTFCIEHQHLLLLQRCAARTRRGR